jgi:hypothetical protein
MAKGHPGGELDDLPKSGLGFAQTAELAADDADVIQPCGLAGSEGERPLESGQRLFRPIELPKGAAEVGQAGPKPGNSSVARWNDSLALIMSSDRSQSLPRS